MMGTNISSVLLNAITAPMMVPSMWALRNTKMNWFNSADCANIDSSLTYHKPAAGGMNGDYPNLEHFDTQDEEIARAVEWITEQNGK
jgi:hypothetical protein